MKFFMKNVSMEELELTPLSQEENLAVSGGADFSGVTVSVSSTARTVTSQCFGNPWGKDFFCYYMLN
jgi:hypothetical protein